MAEISLIQRNNVWGQGVPADTNQNPTVINAAGTPNEVLSPRTDLQNKGYTPLDSASPFSTLYRSGIDTQKTTPTVLSTENALNTLEQQKKQLDQVTPPSTSKLGTEIKTTTSEQKAYFVNANGQEASFTKDQLNDPATKDFLNNNGYVMSKTDFPTDFQITSPDQQQVQYLTNQLDNFTNTLANYNVDTDPQFQAQVQGIKDQFGALISEMQKTNEGRIGALNVLGARTGATQYASSIQGGLVGEEITQGTNRIAELTRQEAATIAAARTAFQSGKFQEFSNKINAIQNLRDQKAKEFDAQNSRLADVLKKVQDSQIQSSRDNAIADLMTRGVTDVSSILGELNSNGGNFTAKEVTDTMKNLATNIGIQNGNVDKLTGDTKNFFLLKDMPNALPKSITSLPEDQQLGAYLQWQKNASTVGSGTSTSDELSGQVLASDSQSILSQTGLSYSAFLVLTGQMSKLSRDAATRNAALKEATAFANKNGVDVSTLSSQYDAANKVLSANIQRQANTKIMENEILGTIGNLGQTVQEADLKNLKMANVAKVWAGQEVNDPLAQRYAMHLYQLREELAGYTAALNGRNGSSITQSDQIAAENIIQNGISTGSLEGLKKAVEDSTAKMGNVMNQSVDAARRSVWDLFGVGSKYKSTAFDTSGVVNEADAQKNVTTYLQQNPDKTTEVTGLIKKMENTLGRPITYSEFVSQYPQYQSTSPNQTSGGFLDAVKSNIGFNLSGGLL